MDLSNIVPCTGCDYSLSDIEIKFENDKSALLAFLISHNLITNSYKCEKCGNILYINPNSSRVRCQRATKVCVGPKKFKKSKCLFTVSIFKDTFLNNSNLPPYKVLTFVRIFLSPNFNYTFLQHNLQLSTGTIADWNSFCREVCQSFAERNSEKLGGKDKTVEIDLTRFSKTKYNTGHPLDVRWVFAGFERGSKKSFFLPVEHCDEETLIAIVREWVQPGTIIVSDCWKAYRDIDSQGYVHRSINCSNNFDPALDEYKPNTELTWQAVKSNIPTFGRRKECFSGYLARHLFLHKYPNEGERFHHFMLAVADLYKPKTL